MALPRGSSFGNFNITSLNAFSTINSTITSLEINMYREIETLQGLEGISIASGGSLIIEGNDKLINLDAIQEGIPSVMDVIRFQEFFYQCGPFISCNELPPAEPQLFTSLEFLSNVTKVEWLRLRGFQGANLNGLENITSVNRLSVWDNPNIINLQELSNITSDLFAVFVSENNQLETLDGLENSPSITDFVSIVANPSLSDFCALQNNISNITDDDDDFTLFLNAYNPTMQDIIDGNCSE
ncbi:MAG: hypothetical protein ACI9Y7_000408 [Dokdonia sp.]|jgi:hypothetical protein